MKLASDYAAHGLALVPIPMGKKGPNAKGWNTHENAITNPDQAAALRGNIGLAHAYSTPPTMALDIDDMPRAQAWLADRGIDLDLLLDADDAVQIVSGREGRAKLIYRLPEGVDPIPLFTLKALKADGEELMVLELRCATLGGLTVQDVLPPSVHPATGKPYEWGGRGHWHNIPTIPESLEELWLNELEKKAAEKALLNRAKQVEDTPRQRALVKDMLNHVSADCSYELYRDIVWAIQSLSWDDSEALAEQWCMTAPDRFEEDNFWTVINSHDPSRSPTIGTIYHYAREGGWNG